VAVVTATRLLVPISESVTLRNTVAHAVRTANEHAAERGGDAVVHFVYPLSERRLADSEREAATEVLDRVATGATEDLGEDADAVTVETALIGADTYLFSPSDYATVVIQYFREHALEAVLLDPEYSPAGTTPLLPPLAAELQRADIPVSEAPVTRDRRGTRLVRPGTAKQFVALFGASFLFYQLLSLSPSLFEFVTGAIAAGVVALSLWHVSLVRPVRPLGTAMQLARLGLYVPFLLWEIAKANLQVAYVVLHPDLPIDPKMVEFDAAVWSSLPVATLANSITLTPGTLTVDVARRHFTVHTLTDDSRTDLLAGGLERAVRFVFYGRSAARIASPAARGDDGGEEE
jgi:multicomponent Na+:H+ antiporter subunit E